MLIGRFLTVNGELWLESVYSINIPKQLQTGHILPSGRTDLVCHDIYSFLFGVALLALIYIPFFFVYHSIYAKFFRLERKNALRRTNSDPSNNLRGYVGIFDPEESEQSSLNVLTKIRLGLTTWWLIKGKRYLKKVYFIQYNIYVGFGVYDFIFLGYFSRPYIGRLCFRTLRIAAFGGSGSCPSDLFCPS